MKIQLSAIALAAAAISPAAFAQSNVTVYGLMDMAISHSNGGTSTVANIRNDKGWAMDGLTSRLGFRGNEDLGGGLRAIYQLEHRLKPDTGASTTANFWEGRSYVGIAGDFGELTLGRDYIPAFYPAITGEPFVYDSTVASAIGHQFAGYAIDGGARSSNGIYYKSPNFNGVTVRAAVSAGEGRRKRGLGGSVEYRQGAIYAGAAVDHQSSDDRLTMGVFAYDFGVVRPMVTYAVSKYAGVSGRAITLGATAPVGKGTARIVYAYLDPDTDAGNLNAGTIRASLGAGAAVREKLGLGYEYHLSKRSSVYTNLGTGKQKIGTRSRTTGVDFGIRHWF